MVEIAGRRPIEIFRVVDREGQQIGQVIQPKTAPVIAFGARTVLLVRGGSIGERLLRI
jgi:hypothetical protein